MSELPVESEPISEVDRLRQEITDLINSGIVEVAVRNPNVLEYMRHWEGKAEKAEAEVERLRAQSETMRKLLHEADKRIVWEHHGLGHNFTDRVEDALND